MVIIKAKTPDVRRIKHRDRTYNIEDVHKTTVSAEKTIRSLKDPKYKHVGGSMWNPLTIIVDLGKDAGEYRYAVFAAKRK